ncbi:homeobox-leucine zipper protein HOX10 [Aegilops tauschii subsp. strangulata]|uniref:Homeobox-leucine zipper protein HOX10 n=6 Tax=Aegilops tauschii subsp. strangulata TaxID=200361 RepID=A0A453JCI9_AEGTS|nr:homeobox-leucine zipper protein HOX10 [Aegilops tauschii subsp. strangulata]
MATAMAMRGGSSDGGGSDRGAGMDSGKYVRYTPEQVETLERVYADCPKPTSSRRQQLLRECPILANIEARQIKVWFQNRRCRDKLRKESSRLESVNRKVSAMNKLLMEENERLQKQVSQLVHENAQVRQQLQNTSMANDASCESNVTTPQNPIRDASNPSGLLSIAEETLTEFLSKATGTAIEWVQMPGMKPGPDSVGIVAISHGCRGVAARACGLVNLEPTKVVEILKDRPSWFRDCRSLEVFTVLPGANGGTIELVYTQLYAPTTLVPARDFWTLRYTTIVEDGSLVVCERSLSGSGGGPSAASAQQFVRAEMLPSGYLVRPCDGGGSIVHIVDHLEFEAWNIPEVLRPLYESSRVVAQKMTTAALRHIRQIAQETSGEVVYALGRQPAVLRTFSQRLSRGFNDAISGFNDDGWSIMAGDGIEDVVVACNSTKKIRNVSNGVNAFEALGGTICAKASMLLQSVPPAILVRFLREHRSEWADYSMDAYLASAVKTSTCSFPGLRPMRFSGSQIIMPLAHTVENEEILEVVRLEGQPLSHDEVLLSRDIDMLQLCTGIDEKSVGSSFQLVFAPIDDFPDDAPLVSSGFRVIPLDMKTDVVSSGRTLDLASSLEVGSTAAQASGASPDDCNVRSVLTIAFQFPYELHLQDSVAAMARQYVRSIVSAVQRVSIAISPSQSGLNAGQRILSGLPEAATLARWICQSYHYHLGVELLTQSDVAGEALLKMLWHYQDAILCCSFKEVPVFTFANKAGLDMLETSLVALQDLTLDKIFDEPGRKALFSEISKLVEEGHVYLPSGVCMSGMGRHVSFDQAVAWKVLGEDSSVHCLALCFVNWSFV